MRVGDLIPLPPNELPLDLQQICYDACPSMLFEGVRHYLQILAGFLWCYFEGYHQCDAQPHSDVKTVLDVSQQLVYAQQHNHHALMREGVQGANIRISFTTFTPPCQFGLSSLKGGAKFLKYRKVVATI